MVAFRNPAAVEADKTGRPGHFLDFFELTAARQHAEMSLVLSFA